MRVPVAHSPFITPQPPSIRYPVPILEAGNVLMIPPEFRVSMGSCIIYTLVPYEVFNKKYRGAQRVLDIEARQVATAATEVDSALGRDVKAADIGVLLGGMVVMQLFVCDVPGALVTILSILFWNLCTISTFEWEAVPHSWIPYVQTGFSIALYKISLLLSDNCDWRPISQ
ncbi:hypothetical protein EVAR_51750_1 [Eumeta japonica]|uniref:Uncharacterized protein n=1 Tax=Eumeta variegata TaxID=151549 RepID=A0A4C1XFK6_EUMVA|nr:hypothetical protein EVAR_51750_1 [Eumeta japonica]